MEREAERELLIVVADADDLNVLVLDQEVNIAALPSAMGGDANPVSARLPQSRI